MCQQKSDDFPVEGSALEVEGKVTRHKGQVEVTVSNGKLANGCSLGWAPKTCSGQARMLKLKLKLKANEVRRRPFA